MYKVYWTENCSRCKEKMLPVDDYDESPIEGYLASHQDGAIDVLLRGGYGQFRDSEDLNATLCNSCAKALNEWLGIDWNTIPPIRITYF